MVIESELYIKRCFQLAERAKDSAMPNPMVGSVLVHEDRIIAEGWHKKYGEAHAEVNCLNNVPDSMRHLIPDATLYVNLEPCAHFGKTPPCAHRIVAEKIKRVVISTPDPFAQVNGRGIEILKNAGIEVITEVLEAEGLWLNRRFFTFHQKGRPYILLKWAQTINGFIAPGNRVRKQISNPFSMIQLHRWRTEEAAIMVGTHTVLIDNPRLNSRLWVGNSPLRVIIDKNLVIPTHFNVYNTDAPTWIINEHKDEERNTIRFIKCTFNKDLISVILAHLHKANIVSVMVEGGQNLLQSFIDNQLWDEARIITSPHYFEQGLAAPLLSAAIPSFQCKLAGDRLDVYTAESQKFPFVKGMTL